MTKKQTQRTLLEKQILKDGYISRNWAIKNYITRLSAHIFDMKDSGWELKTVWDRSPYASDKDCYYFLDRVPPYVFIQYDAYIKAHGLKLKRKRKNEKNPYWG